MLSIGQALILGALQGVTELFPISSLGHSVIFPQLVGWQINQSDPAFITFIVVTHLATALVLLLFFWRDWVNILRGVLRSLVARRLDPTDTYARIGWLLVVSSIPVGILGLSFEKQLSSLFAAPLFASMFLIGNGLLLYVTEQIRLRRPSSEVHSYERVAELSWTKAISVGLMQCVALFPGFSRTGTTLAGGLFVGFSHQDAARYSFLLATPVIFAAALLKVPKLLLSGEALNVPAFVIGGLAAALGAYFSVRYLTNYFKTKKLTPFAFYCISIGILSLVVIIQ